MRGTTNVPGVCVLLKHQGKGLFILRSNTGYKDNEYAVPSGHVEDKESFRQAASREVFEEVGVHIRPEDLVYKVTVHRPSIKDIRIDVWFEALSWSGDPQNMEPDKHSKLEWLDLSNLPDNVIDYMNFGLENINEGNAYGEFGWD